MSHGFKLKYDQMRENVPDDPTQPQAGTENHEHPASDRRLCFVMLDGSRLRFNYGYLIWDEYYPEKNMIVMSFTSHTVTLTGQHLGKLYDSLEKSIPRIIVCTDARYNLTAEAETPTVNVIQIVNNN